VRYFGQINQNKSTTFMYTTFMSTKFMLVFYLHYTANFCERVSGVNFTVHLFHQKDTPGMRVIKVFFGYFLKADSSWSPT